LKFKEIKAQKMDISQFRGIWVIAEHNKKK